MRLVRLDLKAFGPFTEHSLHFTTTTPGLHLIFGANEAGKSSSLRALKALLCGFPQQTPDNFLHNYDQLLVAGCLRNAAGEEVSFQRRKKRRGDVLDAHGNPFDASVLAAFLHGMDGANFTTFYGIDHDALVRGGEEILAQKGEMGQALFSAGSGIASVGEVLERLEAEAADLFKATGQLPAINAAARRYKELQKEMKATALSVKDWKEHRKALYEAEITRTELEYTRDQKSTEMHRLQRLQQAIPELAALQARHDQLQALGEVVLLDADFAERYQQVSRDIREAEHRLQIDRQRLAHLAARHQAIAINPVLLLEAERVDDFHQRLGEFRKGQKDRPERNGMRISLRTEAGRLLQQIRPDLPLDKVESLRPMLGKKKTIQALISQEVAIQQSLSLAERQSRAGQLEYARAEERLKAAQLPVETGSLQLALKTAQKVGELDAQLTKTSEEIEVQQQECLAEMKRAGLWHGDLEALLALPLPLPVTVQQFEKNFDALLVEQRELAGARKNYAKDLLQAQAAIKEGEYAGQVPGEDDLSRTRGKRQEGWKLLCRQWLHGENIEEESREYAGQQNLTEVYAEYVDQADTLADRMRREADRVVLAATLRAQVESLETALANNGQEMQSLQGRIDALARDWNALWQGAGIVPLSAREMGSWLGEIDKLRFKAGDLGKKQLQLGRDKELRVTLRKELVKELLAMGTSLPQGEALTPVVLAAEAVLDKCTSQQKELEKYRERLDKAVKDAAQAGQELQSARGALAEWQELWRKVMAGFGRQDEIRPLEAIDMLEILQVCFDKLKEADDLQKRIDGIDRDAMELNKEVGDLLAKVAPDLIALPLEQAILQLRILLGQAQKDGVVHQELSREMNGLEKEIELAANTYEFAKEQLTELLRLAKCDDPGELPARINRYKEYQGLKEKVVNHEENLAKIGAGVSLAELAAQATALNIDELPALIAAIERDIKERMNPEINRLSQIIGEEHSRLAAMDGGARAAEITEAMERELALIRRLGRRYTLVKLSAKVLQQAIEHYREEHQDPVLKIAADYFRRLTLGSFAGLRADVDEAGQPVLVGVRENTSRLSVDKMSSGTRDQMFLALRLATLAWRLQAEEPMPFIIDDILINFDDARSQATLEILAELGEKMQVILFTHHRRIIDGARQLERREHVQIHELSP